MDTVEGLTNALLILINTGITFRIIFLFVTVVSNPDDAPATKKRILQAVKFLILANSIFAIKALVFKYFLDTSSGGSPVFFW